MSRGTLHQSKVIPFSVWLESMGWKIQVCKGDYEILRMVKRGEGTLLVHAKADAKKHVTLHGLSEKWFWKWKRLRRAANTSPMALGIENKRCFGCASYGEENIGSYRCRKCRLYLEWVGKYDMTVLRMDRLEVADVEV